MRRVRACLAFATGLLAGESVMRFLLDECMPIFCCVSRDTMSLIPVIGMRGMDDESLLEIAASKGQIIITRDLDFNLMLVKNLKPAGVILVRYPEILSPQTVTRLFRAFIAVGGLEHTQGMIAVLRPGRIRFRPLGP